MSASDNSAPACPRCGVPMTGAAPHGPWPVQYECRHCGTVVVPRHHAAASRSTHVCQFPGCGTRVGAAVPACATCAGRLPQALRLELLDAWLQLRWGGLSPAEFVALRDRAAEALGPVPLVVEGGAA